MAHLVNCIFGEAVTTDEMTVPGRVYILLLKSMTTVCVRVTALDILIPHVDIVRYLISEAQCIPYDKVDEAAIQRYDGYTLPIALMLVDLHSCGISRDDIADAQSSTFNTATMLDIYKLLTTVDRPKRKAALAFIKEHLYNVYNT